MRNPRRRRISLSARIFRTRIAGGRFASVASSPLTRAAVINVHHLELFYYVARHGGISSAVRHMPYGIQQPAVSAQILRLEKDLGAKLFERQPFRLTPAGKELMELADPFFSNLEAVAQRLK